VAGNAALHYNQIKNHSEKGKGGYLMKIQEIREIARLWGVNARIGRSKQDIIRDIQIREGYSPCFRTKEECESDCLWKSDCLTNGK
jgi:hypothetical protein